MNQKTEFLVSGMLILEVNGDDVVVRGEAGRTMGQMSAAHELVITPPTSAGIPAVSSVPAPLAADVALSVASTVTPSPEAAPPPSAPAPTTDVTIRAHGPITLILPLNTPLALRGHTDDLVLRDLGDVTVAACDGDLVASGLSSLKVEANIEGDVALRKIAGQSSLQRVSGDLAVAHVGSVRIDRIEGDASLSDLDEVTLNKVEGDLSITQAKTVFVKHVGGDATLTSITESASVNRVEGDLTVTSPGANLAALEVLGDVELNGSLLADGKYWVMAAGDVVARVSGNVRISARAGGKVLLGSPLALESQEGGMTKALLGRAENTAELQIEAGGDVLINNPIPDFTRQRRVVDAELARTMAEVRSELQRAAGAMRSEVRRARDIAGRSVAQQVEMSGASVRDIVRDLFDALAPRPTPPSPPHSAPAASPASPPKSSTPTGDEVHMILKLLESGAITVEEAERLIQALS